MKQVSPEKMQEQREYIEKIKAENSINAQFLYARVETFGCAQNENDSERLRGMLSDMGYRIAESEADADVIIYNTCAVRENAEQRVFGRLGALKSLKESKPHLVIGVCGCMFQQKENIEEIRKKYRHIDLAFGTHSLYEFPELFYKARNEERAFSHIETDGEIAEGISIVRDNSNVAKISVMYGCNNFCTYCIVPYVRGRERSRLPENILKEARDAAKDGYKEIMLLGQNVNSYGKDLEDAIDFATLLEMVCRVDGIERIRFMTSHPKDISPRLIDVMAREDKICKQLHLPIQSGSNRVLEAMNRKYTREAYLDIVKMVRDKIPDIVLTTDIIVGFPTEEDKDLEDTIDLLRQVEFDMAFSFIYSKRRGTPAAKMPMALSDERIHENFNRLNDALNEIALKKNQMLVGREFLIVPEGISKNNDKFLTGRTDGGKIVNFEGSEALVGQAVKVKITEAKTWSLTGEITE